MMNENKNESNLQDAVGKKSSKHITVITAVVVIAVILLNLLVSIIGDKQMAYLDLTRVRYKSGTSTFYTLSEEAKVLIGGGAIPKIQEVNDERRSRGEDPIKLKVVFCADRDVIEGDTLMRYISYTARSLAKEYSDYIEVEYINMAKNPSAVQKYKTTSAASIYASDIIVEFGTEYLVQGVKSFYMIDSGETEPWAYNGEKRMAAMMLAVTRAEAPICCLTYNHGESLFDDKGEIKEEYSTFIKLIHSAGYTVQTIDLEKDDIPEDCRMIITFDPSEDFKAFGNLGQNNVSEIEKLDKYLDSANAFFYICNDTTPVLSSLEEYLEEWGVSVARVADKAGELENYSLIDSVNNTGTGDHGIFLAKYATEGLGASLTEDMRSRSYPPKIVFGNSTVIKPAQNYLKSFSPADETTGTPAYTYYSYYKNGINRNMMDVFITNNTASALIGDEVYEISTDVNPFKLMTVTQEARQIQDGNFSSINKASYVISLASTDFLKNEVLDSTAYGNTDALLSTLRNTGNEVVPSDTPIKVFYDYTVADDAAYVSENPNTWFRCLVWIPMLTAFVIGAVVTIRRRYK